MNPHPTLSANGLLVVDDHELLRLGLRTLVQSHAATSGQVVQVFEARGLQEALTVYSDHQAEIALVLLDLHLPDAHGLSGLTAFVARFPGARVVVLSGVNDPALVREALASGADAYLTKSGDLQDVVHYIGELGLLQLDDGPKRESDKSETSVFLGNDLDAQRGKATGRVLRTAMGEAVQISNRQAQVLDWILVGMSNRDIADKAFVSEGTVKNHVSALLLLFDVRSRAQLIS
ncbi:response regulator, partial [Hydrogenophaga sp.]|uniref:response regulator transcription factor n=1 Tax=Hydrogenophaga sp. TaxID=1904254 RepID=UPI003562FD9A